MQDNLEFLQWLKRFWDQNYPGGEYDAVGRRKGIVGVDGESSFLGSEQQYSRIELKIYF